MRVEFVASFLMWSTVSTVVIASNFGREKNFHLSKRNTKDDTPVWMKNRKPNQRNPSKKFIRREQWGTKNSIGRSTRTARELYKELERDADAMHLLLSSYSMSMPVFAPGVPQPSSPQTPIAPRTPSAMKPIGGIHSPSRGPLATPGSPATKPETPTTQGFIPTPNKVQTSSPFQKIQPTLSPTTVSSLPSLVPFVFIPELSDFPTSATQTSSDPPSPSPATVAKPSQIREVFQCTETGVDLVEEPYPARMNTTFVKIEVYYVVDTFAFLNAYKAPLERKIIAASLPGALKCQIGGPLLLPPNLAGTIIQSNLSISISTISTSEPCTPKEVTSVCRVLKTELEFHINEDIDEQVSAFLAYIKIKEAMDDTAFIDDLEVIDSIVYLRPLPLLPPIVGQEENVINTTKADSDSISVSPWTLGAVIAMCCGGIIALWAWASNRRTRNQRHMQLIEDM